MTSQGGAADRCAGVVLAGGQSSRMQRSKASLAWGGQSLVAHVVAVLGDALDGPVVVVRSPGQELPPLPQGTEVVEDARTGRGPLEGMAAGLRALPAGVGRAYISAVDVPFVVSAFVTCVADALAGSWEAAVPVHAGQAHPLSAAYRVEETLRAVEARLARDELAAHGLLDDLRVLWLEDAELQTADPGLQSLVNVNSPEEYAAALAGKPDAVSRAPRARGARRR